MVKKKDDLIIQVVWKADHAKRANCKAKCVYTFSERDRDYGTQWYNELLKADQVKSATILS